MKMPLLICLSVATSIAANAAEPAPAHRVFDTEVNRAKNQIYLRIELKETPENRDVAALERLCRALDTTGATKFVAFVHLPGKTAAAAYATCGRLRRELPMEVKIVAP